MKRIASLLLCLLLGGMSLYGCGNKTTSAFDGLTPSEIIDRIYENLDEKTELPGLATTEITTDNSAYYLGTTAVPMVAGAASEPLINAIPYSVCVVRVSENADVAAVKEQIRTSANPGKWVCVMVEDQNVAVDSVGDVVLLVMAEQSEALLSAFRKAAGAK